MIVNRKEVREAIAEMAEVGFKYGKLDRKTYLRIRKDYSSKPTGDQHPEKPAETHRREN